MSFDTLFTLSFVSCPSRRGWFGPLRGHDMVMSGKPREWCQASRGDHCCGRPKGHEGTHSCISCWDDGGFTEWSHQGEEQ